MRKFLAATAVGAALVLATPTSAWAFREVDPAPAATVDVSVRSSGFRNVAVLVTVTFQPPGGSDPVFIPPDSPDVPNDTVDVLFVKPDVT